MNPEVAINPESAGNPSTEPLSAQLAPHQATREFGRYDPNQQGGHYGMCKFSNTVITYLANGTAS